MALASLIIGCATLDDGITPRAALPFLGQSLIEYQARQAAAVGAKHIVILVERVPAALVGAIDRLKKDGVGVELARTVADAADRIHPDEQLLLIGDGVIAREETLRLAARASAPALFTIPDSGAAMRHERIDAGVRWAGIALIDGTMLRKTVAMLGDWDLQSTLLRRIVQAEPHRLDTGAASAWLVEHPDHGRDVELALLGSGGMLPQRANALLLDRGIRPGWLRGASLAIAATAVIAFAYGWLATGAVLLTASGPVAAIPRRLDRIGLRAAGQERLWRQGQALLFALALLALAWALDGAGAGWGVWPLALGTIGLGGLLWDQTRLSGHSPTQPSLLAAPLLLSLAGFPVVGLAGTTLLAAGLLAYRQRGISLPDPL